MVLMLTSIDISVDIDIDDLRQWTCFLQGGRTGQWKGGCDKDYREPGGKYKGGQCTLFAQHRCSWIKVVDFRYLLCTNRRLNSQGLW